MAFLEATQQDLPFIFDVAGPLLPSHVNESLWPAWRALEERNEFGALREAIQDGRYDDRLDRAGLSGPELDFKLAGFDNARDVGRQTRAPRWLKWIDVILGSLLSALGIGEGIKELKEGVEAEMEPKEGQEW